VVIAAYLENGQSPDEGHNFVLYCMWFLRDDLLAWLRE
jgi:hypothetical protein